MDEEVVLRGGLINPGAVVRVGDTVHRPVRPGSEAVWALLGHLEGVGFDEAPRFLGVDDQGREVLSFIEGEVGVPVGGPPFGVGQRRQGSPYPAWLTRNDTLEETARLLGRYHDAAAGFEWRSHTGWATGLVDAARPELVCHNDVDLLNVVFRDGRAVGLVDFDFAAPGRRVWDVAQAARMWAPLTHPQFRWAWPHGIDTAERLGICAAAYGLGVDRAAEFVDTVLATRQLGADVVRRRAEAGDKAYAAMWEARGGDERAAIDQRWVEENRERFLEAVVKRCERG